MLQVLLLAVPSLAMLSLLVYLERDGGDETDAPTKRTSRKARKRALAKHR